MQNLMLHKKFGAVEIGFLHNNKLGTKTLWFLLYLCVFTYKAGVFCINLNKVFTEYANVKSPHLY